MRATEQGTARYAARFSDAGANGFYRRAQSLTVSSLGLGTYLGELTGAADDSYVAAIQAALAGGINFLDTAINYRHQRSERNIGEALARSGLARDEVIICTKAGFLTPGAVPDHVTQTAGNMHCMEPSFLAGQIDRSRANLQVETIDVFYLHNPETQLDHIDGCEFDDRIRRAFARLEQLASDGKIGWYGTATWNGYRAKPSDRSRLSLKRMIELARAVAGDEHRFRFIQLPLNLAMPEAFTLPQEQDRGEGISVLEVAARAGITVVASATLLQARLAANLPDHVAAALPGAGTDAERCIQFTRSTPGVTVALVGMGTPAHVAANLAVTRYAPMTVEDYLKLYERGR